jgi:sialidase-1
MKTAIRRGVFLMSMAGLALGGLICAPAVFYAGAQSAARSGRAVAAVLKTPQSELLMIFYAGSGHTTRRSERFPKRGKLMCMSSRDGGHTWTKPRTIIDSEVDDRDPSVTRLSDGTLLCNFFMTTYDHERKTAHIRVAVARSADGGKTWAEPRKVKTPLDWVAACSAPVVELSDGSLVMPIYGAPLSDHKPKEHYAGHLKAAVVRSYDRGRTWKDFSVITPNAAEERSEPALIELTDGRLFCVIRRKAFGSFSLDKGKTWTPAEKIKAFGGYCYAPDLIRTSSGALVCAYHGVNINVSIDEAKTWLPRKQVAKGYGYPSLAELADGRVICIFYDDKAEHLKKNVRAEIRGVTFRVDKAGAIVDISEPWVILKPDARAEWGTHPGFPCVVRIRAGKDAEGSASK